MGAVLTREGSESILAQIGAEMGTLQICGYSMGRTGRTESLWVLYGQKWAQYWPEKVLSQFGLNRGRNGRTSSMWVLYGQKWAQYWPEKVMSKFGLNRGRNGRTSSIWVLYRQKWAYWALWVLSGQKWAQYWLLVHLESIWAEMGALSICGYFMGRNGRTEHMWVLYGQKLAQYWLLVQFESIWTRVSFRD